jgi:hypothetical protein
LQRYGKSEAIPYFKLKFEMQWRSLMQLPEHRESELGRVPTRTLIQLPLYRSPVRTKPEYRPQHVNHRNSR